MPTEPAGRRPLKSRDCPFFKNLAAGLARAGATPNGISFASIVFGGCAGAALAATAHCEGWALRACWLGAAAFIQLRLIANLLDGMVAVEGGKGGPTGDLWNEAPDRVSDAAIFIGAGYAAGSSPMLGFARGAGGGVRRVRARARRERRRRADLPRPAGEAASDGADDRCMRARVCRLPLFPTAIGDSSRSSRSLLRSALWLVILGGAVTAWRRLSFIADFLRKKSHP